MKKWKRRLQRQKALLALYAKFRNQFSNICLWCHLQRWKRCSSWLILMATCYCVALNSGECCRANENLHNASITLKDLQFSRYHNNWTGRRWKESRKATRRSPSWIATATTRSASKSSSRSIRLRRLKYILSLIRRRPSWARMRREEPSRAWTTTGETVRGKILSCLQKNKTVLC